jgi:hypothetical protein
LHIRLNFLPPRNDGAHPDAHSGDTANPKTTIEGNNANRKTTTGESPLSFLRREPVPLFRGRMGVRSLPANRKIPFVSNTANRKSTIKGTALRGEAAIKHKKSTALDRLRRSKLVPLPQS